ncbi:microcephalin isoform X1 [Orcinus orca]|uniref:microcephalin isoform X1 n=1 Tax=Orcinus orca TaxID=9733 RepID=UPI00211213A7|nr:microcephalin isoform X1 [Orcinus orca]
MRVWARRACLHFSRGWALFPPPRPSIGGLENAEQRISAQQELSGARPRCACSVPPLRQARGSAAASSPPPLMAAPETLGGPVLKDVVAYVEVWSASGTENYSKTFTNQLADMGAKVSKTFNKEVTHVVFKDGYQSTWAKAQKRGVKLVSVLWVEKCRTAGVHIDESLFPAANPDEHLPSLMKKKRKCMQPKDFMPKTPENDKRLQKKFEKMAKELQQQKTTVADHVLSDLPVLQPHLSSAPLCCQPSYLCHLAIFPAPVIVYLERIQQNDNDVPVLLFESNGSLGYSPTVKICSGHHSAVEKRLQEMKEKRENLSPTSSQIVEKSDDNTVNALCEASLNLSHDTLCSEDSFAGVLRLSFDDLCGSSGYGTQQRRLGGFLDESKSAACASSAVLKTRSVRPPASPGPLGQLTLHQPPGSLSKGDTHRQRVAAGQVITPDVKPAREPAERVFDEKRGLSPTPSVTNEPAGGPSCPQSPSATRRRVSANSSPPPEERLSKRRCLGWPPTPRLQLENSPKCASSSAVETLGRGESSYDDYFSPDNLKERDSGSLLPGVQPPAGPALLHCMRSLSRRERTSLLERADFSCIGRSPRSARGTDSTVKAGFRLQKPANYGADPGLSSVTSKETPAAEGTPGDCPRAKARGGGDARPGGSDSPHTLNGLTLQKGLRGDFTSLKGSNKEVKGWIDIKSTQKEDTPSKMVNSPESEAQSDDKLNFVGDWDVEKSAEAMEELPRGCSESVKRGPARHDVLDGSWEASRISSDLMRNQGRERKARSQQEH